MVQIVQAVQTVQVVQLMIIDFDQTLN